MRFEYQGVNDDGHAVSGTVDAVDRASAVSSLAESGCFATSLADQGQAKNTISQKTSDSTKPASKSYISRRPGSKDILAMTGQLSTALQAGLPLLDCLEIIRRQQRKNSMQKLLADIVGRVSSGESLSGAMAAHPKVFSSLYLAMVRVGETGGILEKTTAQLTKLLSREEKIKTHMKNSATYPAILLAVGVASVIVVVTWILPNIVENIIGGSAILPFPTRMLLAMSDLVRNYGLPAAVVIVGLFFLFKKIVATPKGRLRWDGFKLRLPVFGSVLRAIAVGRFAGTLGSLSKGGIPILDGLAVVRNTLGNEALAIRIDIVAEKVKAGSSLAEPLEYAELPPLLVQIAAVGEQTGKLDELLLQASETFDGEADTAINRFMTILPTVLVLLLALVIGFIVAATLLPIVVMELGAAGM